MPFPSRRGGQAVFACRIRRWRCPYWGKAPCEERLSGNREGDAFPRQGSGFRAFFARVARKARLYPRYRLQGLQHSGPAYGGSACCLWHCLHPRSAKAVLYWICCTNTGLVRQALRLTPQVNGGCLQPPVRPDVSLAKAAKSLPVPGTRYGARGLHDSFVAYGGSEFRLRGPRGRGPEGPPGPLCVGRSFILRNQAQNKALSMLFPGASEGGIPC